MKYILGPIAGIAVLAGLAWLGLSVGPVVGLGIFVLTAMIVAVKLK